MRTLRTSLTFRTSLTGLLAATAALPAFAHEGHGFSGPHWHATDAAIFIALAVAVGIAFWAGRK